MLVFQVPSGNAKVGFEWGKQDLSVDGNGAGQQQHTNGNGHHPEKQQHQQPPPQVACTAVHFACGLAADNTAVEICAVLLNYVDMMLYC